MADFDPSEKTPEECARLLGTDLVLGLTSRQAEARLREDGPNELEKPVRPTLLTLFFLQLTGFVIVLLMIAAFTSLVVAGTGPHRSDVLSYVTGKAIFAIVFANAAIAAWAEHRAGDALDALARMTQATALVVRDGREVRIEVAAVVRGDVVLLATGDTVPADCRLISAVDLKVCELCLTGEKEEVEKTCRFSDQTWPCAMGRENSDPDKVTQENCVFAGCSVAGGRGAAVACATGARTRLGRVSDMVAGDDGPGGQADCGCLPDLSANATPLQQHVDKLGSRVGILAVLACATIFIAGVSLDRTDHPGSPSWLYMTLIAVTLAVAAIPEGLPLCVTISLSIGCSEMAKKNVLVRTLSAVEMLGSASVICTDKTGTLTESRMTMVHLWSGGTSYDTEGKGFDPTSGGIRREGPMGTDAAFELGVRTTLFSALLCSDTTLHKVVHAESGAETWEPRGSSAEAPLVVAARRVGLSEAMARECPRLFEVPFAPKRRATLTCCGVSGREVLCPGGMALPADAACFVACKGAPSVVLDRCTEQLLADGSSEPLTNASRAAVAGVIDAYCSRALFVLAVAGRALPRLPCEDEQEAAMGAEQRFDALARGLCLLGIVACADPHRQGVPEAVSVARGAGIRVVMVTGDHLRTAIAVARGVNILQKSDTDQLTAVDCVRMRPHGPYISSDKLDLMTASVRVFARALPEDKLQIVMSLQRQGAVTAMTGDGVNDAPALKQANIGVAMGLQGTEVAKSAADMVLTDDNFCSIIAAVEKGRTVYAGIQKFIAFIMSVHIAEVAQILLCIVAGIPVMRTPLQILFLILVTDLPPSIALGMEPGERTTLKDRPRPKDEPVVLGWMWLSMVMNGLVLTAVIFAVYVGALVYYCDGEVFHHDIVHVEDYKGKLMSARTVAFISLVWAENVRAYTARSFDKPVWRDVCGNLEMHKAIFVAQACLYAAVLIPFLSDEVLQLRALSLGPSGWLLALIGPVGCLVLCEACKLVTAYQVRQHQNFLALRNAVEDTRRGLKFMEDREREAPRRRPPRDKRSPQRGLNQLLAKLCECLVGLLAGGGGGRAGAAG